MSLALDVGRVVMMPTSTEKNNNTSPTAASAGTDLNGAAAVRAAKAIKRRLKQFAAQRLLCRLRAWAFAFQQLMSNSATMQVFDTRRPDMRIHFGQLCAEARRNRVDLGARGFYATPGVDFNRETGQGTPFFYFTQGAAVAEVLGRSLHRRAASRRASIC